MVVPGFPVMSQTFVSLQIAELIRQGHQVSIYNLGRRGRREWLPAGVGGELEQVRVRHLGTRKRKRAISPLLLQKLIHLGARRPKAVRRALSEVLLQSGYRSFSKLIGDAYVMRDLAQSEVDIIHCQFATLIVRVLKLRQFGFIDGGPKVICSVRGYDITREKNADRARWASIFGGVDRFLPVCRALERALTRKGCDKPIAIVGSPVDVEHIQSMAPHESSEEPLRLVSIGRLIEKKGIEDALAAAKILKERGLDFRYSIIGDGKLRRSLTEYVDIHGLNDRVRFLGALPSSGSLRILGSCHILVAPSKTAMDGNSEGIPNVLKEAMLIGVQVVSTTHSGIPELIRHQENGYLCKESSPEELARTIEFVADHRERWEATAECAAKTIMTEYTPQKTTDDLIEAYRATLR